MDDDHREDGGFQRFFCYLNLFMFSMLVLVLGRQPRAHVRRLGGRRALLLPPDRVLVQRPLRTPTAGSKAFIVNRIGDFGFLLGIFLLFWALADAGTPTSRSAISRPASARSPSGPSRSPSRSPSCRARRPEARDADRPLLLRRRGGQVGADPALRLAPRRDGGSDAGLGADPCRDDGHGRRLHGLPARRSSTTPHRARRPPSPGSARLTALFAATIALVQTDIKKVLAYSTVSQLGYMFLARGRRARTSPRSSTS